jgi:5-methylcytosine-specific restriction endonuclease McrA
MRQNKKTGAHSGIARARKHHARIGSVRREAIIERDNQTCHICERYVERRNLVLDHVIPLSLGGSHTEDNLAVAHRSCNARKGNRPLSELSKLTGTLLIRKA